ncbi:hypothetical protein wTpre_572 [Wolbachia endosymbiont of Trichogramma pretiosum]|nr:hypothetical protein wTpre_572 [Wolbachia endosymbiont of Trichogramma pretiosum]
MKNWLKDLQTKIDFELSKYLYHQYNGILSMRKQFFHQNKKFYSTENKKEFANFHTDRISLLKPRNFNVLRYLFRAICKSLLPFLSLHSQLYKHFGLWAIRVADGFIQVLDTVIQIGPKLVNTLQRFGWNSVKGLDASVKHWNYTICCAIYLQK